MVATGFYKLHEWKKSQVELTKIIKTDKTSVDAFTMLGEVLLRQGDRQRALPVLKHALGLDKYDPKIKVLLECAKDGRNLPPLDPLPPVLEPSKKLGRVGLKKRRAETGDIVEKMPLKSKADPRIDVEDQNNRIDSAAALTIRKRVSGGDKPEAAASRGLESSANAGEDHIERVLAAGLFDFPNVPVPLTFKRKYEVKLKRSKKKKRIAILGLFVLFGVAFQGWKWAIESRYKGDKGVTLAENPDGAGLRTGTWGEIHSIIGDEIPGEFVGETGQSMLSAHAIALLGYRKVSDESILGVLENYSKNPGDGADEKSRDHVIASHAFKLYLYELGNKDLDLSLTLNELKAWNDEHENDSLMLWLEGRAHFLSRNYTQAKDTMGLALEANPNNMLASIDALTLTDTSPTKRLRELSTLSQKEDSPPHAKLIKAFVSTDEGVGFDESLSDISVGVGKVNEDTLESWQHLASAAIKLGIEDYLGAKESLEQAQNLKDPFFNYRQALLYIGLGEYKMAQDKIKSDVYDTKNKNKVFGRRVAAEIAFSQGKYAECIKMTAKSEARWAGFLRGKCLFESNRPKDAFAIFQKLSTDYLEDTLLSSWTLAAGLDEKTDNERKEGLDELLAFSRKSNSQEPLYC